MSTQSVSKSISNDEQGFTGKGAAPHPAGRIKHGVLVQILRLVVFVDWFMCCAASTHLTQLLGIPLYFVSKDYYYAYMALTKQSFGLLITTLTQWFSPTVIRVSGDRSVRGQLIRTEDGLLQTRFPERLVMIANHQLYLDWLYIWWIAYTNRMHGHIFIVLKESLKYIPVIGPGIMFYGFVFMARKWETDRPRLQHRLKRLKTRHGGPLSGTQSLDPMWLLLFPEGTNLSANTRKGSAKYAKKMGVEDFRHQLLPRSTGLQFCLNELSDTVEWVYDCTLAYEGVPRNGYGQDYFTLRSAYFQGRPPKSVNMYWRRFAISSIPVRNSAAFALWVKQVWQEKEDLLEYYGQNGRFPSDDGVEIDALTQATAEPQLRHGSGFIETEVRIGHWYEVGQIFVVMAALAMVANVLARSWNLVKYGTLAGAG